MDRIRWAMFNLWDNAFSWGNAVKYFSTFVVKTSYVFIRLMLPIFFFLRLFVPMFTMLNMNNSNRKIRFVIKRRLNCRNIAISMYNSFSKMYGLNFLADWRFIYLKFVRMFKKYNTKELRVRASFRFLNKVGHCH